MLTGVLRRGEHGMRFTAHLPRTLGGGLPAGRYELRVRATDAAGNRSRRHSFRVRGGERNPAAERRIRCSS